MSSAKPGRNDPCPCASGKKHKNCCLAALQQSKPAAVRPLDTATGQSLMNGFALYQAGRFDEAAKLCDQILLRYPSQADALHLRGLVAQSQGDLSRALALVDRALAIAPNFSMHSNRGGILRALGRSREAVEAYRAALADQPDSVPLLCNMATALEAQQLWDEVEVLYDRVLELDPLNVAVLCGQGFRAQLKGDLDGAERRLLAALVRQPRHAPSLSNLGNVKWARGDLDGALLLYREAVAADPRDLMALHNMGEVLLNQSRLMEARECFDQAYRVQPNLETRMRRDLLLPHVCESREQMMQWRADFESHLDVLIQDCKPVETPTARDYCSSIWKLAFHGENDLALMRKIARFYSTLYPDLEYRAGHVDHPLEVGRRVRIGFFSSYLGAQHSVPRCVAALICLLAEDPRFDVYLIAPKFEDEDQHGPYADFKGRFVAVGKDYAQARPLVEAQELDILVYQDIGMDPLSYFLAHARLARVQCVLGGHPVTTGIPNLDCFVSTALAESESAAADYSEELLLLPGLPVVYKHPEIPARLKARADMGLPAHGALYLCPMMLQKMHPDFDQAIERLLLRDPAGHVVLFRHVNARWEEQLQRRFEKSIAAEVRERIVFMPWLDDYGDFISVNALADVVIDPFHFGIGSTVVATFAVGTPIVTWPSPYLRGRAGLAYCRLMDVSDECVATDLDDYVERAVRIAHDGVLRQALQQRILSHKARLFDNEQPVHDLARLFVQLADRLPLTREVA